MNPVFILSLFCLFVFPIFKTFGQDKNYINQGSSLLYQNRYDEALVAFKNALEEDSLEVTALYGMAYILYNKEQSLKKAQSRKMLLKDLTGLYDTLEVAYDFSLKAQKEYEKLSDGKKMAVRQRVAISEDEITQYLPVRINNEAFKLLNGAPYRKDTYQLYASKLYNRTLHADTLGVLRESLFDLCTRFLDEFPNEGFNKKIGQLRKDLLREYTQVQSLRQYGDRSGKMYEKHCLQVLELFSDQEIKHIFPEFYASEFDIGVRSTAHNTNYKKLESLADKYNTTILDLLCQLNIHYGGCGENNQKLYHDFITTMAPLDIAYIALQRKARPFIHSRDYENAVAVFNQYKSLFPNKKEMIAKVIDLLNEHDGGRHLVNLGSKVNSPNNDYEPVISLDGSTLYFARKTGESGENVYMSTKDIHGNWTEAIPLPPSINTSSHEIPQGINAMNDTLLLYGNYSRLKRFAYVNSIESRLGKGDFYYSSKNKEGKWESINVFPYPVNTKHYEAGLSITADGQALLFASDRPSGAYDYNPNYPDKKLYYHGSGEFNTDLYVSVKDGKEWGEPINLGKVINTPFAEKNPYLHPDMETLYFSSDGHYGLGGYDIYMSKRLNKDSWTEWSEPVNIGKVINSPYDDTFYISPTGKTALLVSNKESENYGKSDIYEAELPEEVRPEPILIVPGKVTDNIGQPIQTEIVITDKETHEEVATAKSSSKDGSFILFLSPEKEYLVYPKKTDFFGSGVLLEINQDMGARIHKKEELKMVNTSDTGIGEQTFVLKTLYFDNNSATIRPKSFFDLDRLFGVLEASPKMKISIEGHTDSNADIDFNLDLSERRAEAVKNYLVNKGCESDRLFTKGFGEEIPIAENESSEGRQLNRRVEFRIIE
ncbi:OmpA family protein [Sediminitomix flava]|uniref:WD40 repeat protein n=1 Tax=Sediminitomix flava TaxID=379075 RepID=A0A315Z5T6_SEDFL|nr:OmpA family protein [Sediminitomix flava]PWJ39217.1 WD40 repeat protein [Sediminitomix flava]